MNTYALETSATYLPWWLAGVFLIVVPILYGCSRFGVSGILERLLFRKETIDIAESDEFSKNPELLKASLSGKEVDPAQMRALNKAAVNTWLSSLTLILGIFLGGLVDASLFSEFEFSKTLAETHIQYFGESAQMFIVLFLGGLCVGWGTRLAGGCSSGHGLSGCGRLEKMSYLATGVFFGTAIVVTYALNHMFTGV